MNFQEKEDKLINIMYLGEEGDLESLKAQYKDDSDFQDSLDALALVKNAFSQLPERNPNYRSIHKIMQEARRFHELPTKEKSSIFNILSSYISRFNLAPAAVAVFVVVAVVQGLNIAPWSSEGFSSAIDAVADAARPEDMKGQLIDAPLHGLNQQQFQPHNGATSFGGLRPVAIDDQEDLGNVPGLFPSDEVAGGGNLDMFFAQRQKALMESDADTLLMRGRRYQSAGRIDLALRDFETIYRYYPNYTYMGDVLMHRARCFAFQGQYDDAIASLEIFVEKYPAKKGLVLPMIDQIEKSKAASIVE